MLNWRVLQLKSFIKFVHVDISHIGLAALSEPYTVGLSTCS